MRERRPNFARLNTRYSPQSLGAKLGSPALLGVKMILARNPPEKFAGGGDFYAFGD